MVDCPRPPLLLGRQGGLGSDSMSKGFGFTEFMDELQQKQSLTECQGTAGLGATPALLSMAITKVSHMKLVEYNQMCIDSYNEC